jgi:hypothetical protein
MGEVSFDGMYSIRVVYYVARDKERRHAWVCWIVIGWSIMWTPYKNLVSSCSS